MAATAMLTGGCAVGGTQGGDEPAAMDEPRVRAVVRAPGEDTSDVAAGTSPPGTDSPVDGAAPARPTPGGAGDTPGRTSAPVGEGAAAFRTVLDVVDPRGDAGLQGRPPGDLTRLRIEDDGVRARVTVELAGDLPVPPADGEVFGIGVDVFRTRTDDSDFQLFVLGNADGWRAGVYVGREQVDSGGTFELAGNMLVFTLPWSSLGGRRAGSASVFADWSRRSVAVVAESSEDHAPDRGAHPFSFPS